jgi:hypothetical protein
MDWCECEGAWCLCCCLPSLDSRAGIMLVTMKERGWLPFFYSLVWTVIDPHSTEYTTINFFSFFIFFLKKNTKLNPNSFT